MENFRLLCLGDSLTEGYDIDPRDCWVDLLREREGLDVTNAGISGDMTAGMLARLPLALEKKEYTHVFIMGGTNDVEFGLSPNIIISNIKAAMRQLRHHGIHCAVGIPMPFDDKKTNLTHFEYVGCGTEYSKKIDEYCDGLRSFLEEDETAFIDFREFFKDGNGRIRSDLFLPDGLHPNRDGHELVYEKILKYYSNL
ncbi:MAG TPA: GDSL-type esterase/lipase family protein [Clostridia bacterium]|nr:GDSL-type esterase/lipase family protein [Clostridia bacterium]